MVGKIVKGIAGFYYVDVALDEDRTCVYECKAKGAFRSQNMKPLVGDMVEIDILDEEKMIGNISEILKRKNELIRPAVANVDQCIIVFALAKPDPNRNLLDRFLLQMSKQEIKTIICFSKLDLVDEEKAREISNDYALAGYETIAISTKENLHLDTIKSVIHGKTTVLAGPSGVGKSTLMNAIYPEAAMETGDISRKIERGKHTTRHTELFKLEEETYFLDTPGFSSLYIDMFTDDDLKDYYPEFVEYEPYCKFAGCKHYKETACGVKDALLEGKIAQLRYDNYVQMLTELQEKRRW